MDVLCAAASSLALCVDINSAGCPSLRAAFRKPFISTPFDDVMPTGLEQKASF